MGDKASFGLLSKWFFLLLFGQPSFQRMARPTEYAPICLSSEIVAVRVGHKVFAESEDSVLMIVGNPKGILDQLLRPHSNHL